MTHKTNLINFVVFRPCRAAFDSTYITIRNIFHRTGIAYVFRRIIAHNVFILVLRHFKHTDVVTLGERYLMLDFIIPDPPQFALRSAHCKSPRLDPSKPEFGGSTLVVVENGRIFRRTLFFFPDIVGGEIEDQVFGFSFIDVDHIFFFW